MAGIALNAITLTLTKTNRNTFENELNQWFIKYKSFLNERTITRKQEEVMTRTNAYAVRFLA